LREHVKDNVRLHYQITHGGGAPNVVPDFAEVFYYIRTYMSEEVEDVTERVIKVAKGAAMMTETEMEMIYDSGTTCVLSNHILSDLQYAVMQKLGPIEFTAEEMAYAAKINNQNPPGMRSYLQNRIKLTDEEVAQPLLGQVHTVGIGHKVMMYAAQVMAGAAVDLFKDPARLQAVRDEFEAHIVRRPYKSPLPDDCRPPHNSHPLR
ncbi:MAG: hypothetical protein ACE5EY_17345, partial [Anaerolineae bacterium]